MCVFAIRRIWFWLPEKSIIKTYQVIKTTIMAMKSRKQEWQGIKWKRYSSFTARPTKSTLHIFPQTNRAAVIEIILNFFALVQLQQKTVLYWVLPGACFSTYKCEIAHCRQEGSQGRMNCTASLIWGEKTLSSSRFYPSMGNILLTMFCAEKMWWNISFLCCFICGQIPIFQQQSSKQKKKQWMSKPLELVKKLVAERKESKSSLHPKKPYDCWKKPSPNKNSVAWQSQKGIPSACKL